LRPKPNFRASTRNGDISLYTNSDFANPINLDFLSSPAEIFATDPTRHRLTRRTFTVEDIGPLVTGLEKSKAADSRCDDGPGRLNQVARV